MFVFSTNPPLLCLRAVILVVLCPSLNCWRNYPSSMQNTDPTRNSCQCSEIFASETFAQVISSYRASHHSLVRPHTEQVIQEKNHSCSERTWTLSLRPHAPQESLNFWNHLSKCNHWYKQKDWSRDSTLCGKEASVMIQICGSAKKLWENLKKFLTNIAMTWLLPITYTTNILRVPGRTCRWILVTYILYWLDFTSELLFQGGKLR